MWAGRRSTKHLLAADPTDQVVQGLPREEMFGDYPETLLSEAAEILLNSSTLL